MSLKKCAMRLIESGTSETVEGIEPGYVTEECAMHLIESGTRETVKGIELENHKSIRILREKENYMYLRILGANTIKQAEMKKKSAVDE